jgi:CspA family cold shock protein
MDDALTGKPYEDEWLRDVLGDAAKSEEVRREAFRNVDVVCRGQVKFFKAEKGWGGIESSDTPSDVWVIWSVIDSDGYRDLSPGELVEFRWEPAIQDSWRCRATWVRSLEGRPH